MGADVLIVPDAKFGRKAIDAECIQTIKRIKQKIPKTSVFENEKTKISDFRCIDVDVPLMIINNPFLSGIVGGIIGTAIYDISKDFIKKKMENPDNKLIKEPIVKAKFYETKTKRYFEFEGPAGELSKEIIDTLK